MVALGAGAVVAAAGAAFLLARKSNDGREAFISDAPPWTHKDKPSGEHGELIGRSQTINRPRHEIYNRWRDFARFPDFMDNVRAVEKLDEKKSRWTIEAPAGKTVELITEITHDVSGERIAWKSVEESQIDTRGEVLFKDRAPVRRRRCPATIASPSGLEPRRFLRSAGGIAGTVAMRAGTGEMAALDDQIFVADRPVVEEALEDLANPRGIARLRR